MFDHCRGYLNETSYMSLMPDFNSDEALESKSLEEVLNDANFST